MAILLQFCITNIIFVDNHVYIFFGFIGTEIPLFLKYLGGTHSG